MKSSNRKSAFTLIEVLVVVAIIALLVAILLPSLNRARAQAKMVQCQTNMRQILMAFTMYTVENKGRFPGERADLYADWLGGSNRNRLTGNLPGRQPEDGVIFKYMGKDKWVYVCPDDRQEAKVNAGQWYYSYTMNLLLSGGKAEMVAGAHHPMANFNSKDHRPGAATRMKAFEGVPILIEEDTDFYLLNSDDSGWCNEDCVTDRHLRNNSRGYGNMGYVDTHVGRVQLPPQKKNSSGGKAISDDKVFYANNLCIRTKGGKWVSGWSWDTRSAMYGYIDESAPASSEGVQH